jgi:Protein of unknown function (DUF3300)
MKNIPKQLLVWLLAVLMVWPWPLRLNAQSNGTTFKPEEIEQFVAPIALYPDSLVSQILMASTYPLEVVQADRWAKANKTLKGEALTRALEAQSWDPSVKSLVNFPQVLAAMSEKLDVTLKLGDAFLAQQKDVMNAIQRLRAKAQAQGNLKTTKEQTVIVEQPAAQTTVVEQPAASVRSDIQPDCGVWRVALSSLSTLCVLSIRVCGHGGICLYRRGRAGRGMGLRLGWMQLARR